MGTDVGSGDLVVQKYGGTSVADAACLFKVARRVVQTQDAGHPVCVVVSASGDTTDELLRLAHEVSPRPPLRELDMLLSTGERISCSLLAMAIARLGREAVSFTGSQAGIITDGDHGRARIVELRVGRLREALAQGKITLVAGFQGVSTEANVTTLGRGGSDTTAVALAGELKASACEIYTDVDGVYTANPSVVAEAYSLPEISYEEMLELTASGAEVLARPSVELALKERVPVHVRSSFSDAPGTWVRTSVEESQGAGICGVTYSLGEVFIAVPWVAENTPELVAALRAHHDGFAVLGIEKGAADQSSQLICCAHQDDISPAEAGLSELLGKRTASRATVRTGLSRVSVIGRDVSGDQTLSTRMLAALEKWQPSGAWLAPSGLRVSCLVPVPAAEAAIVALHALFCAKAATDSGTSSAQVRLSKSSSVHDSEPESSLGTEILSR